MFYKLNKKKLANALRFLSIDAVQLAGSGHPGMPMGMADIAEVLWNDFLSHNPGNPQWINRDRFILSNGHGSMLQYALLHLSGYDVTIEDLQQFRQLHSKTPGHPEYKITPGVEATTGPLGQGIGMAVGMALAEQLLSRTFNRENFNIIDHYIYCFVGDGCLMEGISHEVCSLAGTIGLNKLIVFWDNNQISIDGKTDHWFTENIPQRFAAYNWNVIDNIDGHNPDSITKAITKAKLETRKPSLLCCKTIIGYGSPIAGTETCHGAPLGQKEILATRKQLNWEYKPFVIPEEIYNAWNSQNKGGVVNAEWNKKVQKYSKQYPELFSELERRISNKLPNNWNKAIENLLVQVTQNPKNIATRQASKIVLDALSKELPELFGGSADLSHSNLTLHNNAVAFNESHEQNETHNEDNKIFNYLHYGVREFGMFAIMNGMALYKGFIPYGGTFLVFADYAKSALRLSALMQQKVIYVLSHDSIGLGEDGPTHQPIEQLSMLRMTPNLSVWRPCDTVETMIAWQKSINPELINTSCLVLSRQAVVQQNRNASMLDNIKNGGYVLYDPINPQAIIIATGSEVELAMQAAKQLAKEFAIRVVSMPNMNIFLKQSADYQESVLPRNIVARVAVEAGNTFIWHKFVGLNGKVVGVDRFGLSAPGTQVYQDLNITVDAVKQAVLQVIDINKKTTH